MEWAVDRGHPAKLGEGEIYGNDRADPLAGDAVAGVTTVDSSEKTLGVYAKRNDTRGVLYILRYPCFTITSYVVAWVEKIVFTFLSLMPDRQTWQGQPVARFGAGCT